MPNTNPSRRSCRGGGSKHKRDTERLQQRLDDQAATEALGCPKCGNPEASGMVVCEECGWHSHLPE